MTHVRARNWIALGAGTLFGSGLVLSGMTKPSKVLGFLDVSGAFDASLLFVMAGAIAVFSIAYRWGLPRGTPVFDKSFHQPAPRRVDAKLVAGAAIFGVGWGISGYCPGPAVVSLAGGGLPVVWFIACVFVGSAGAGLLERVFAPRRAPSNIAHAGDSEAG